MSTYRFISAQKGPTRRQVYWRRYAGAYAYGKTHRERYVDEHGQPRSRIRRLPRADWEVLKIQTGPPFARRKRSNRSAKPGAAATKCPAPGATRRCASRATARASQMRSIPGV